MNQFASLWANDRQSLPAWAAPFISIPRLPETGGKGLTYPLVMALGALAVVAGLGLARLRRR